MSYIHQILDFVLLTVIAKVIIAHWLAEKLLKYGRLWLDRSERSVAIWLHFQERAKGAGHGASSVLDCGQGKCAIF